MDIAFLTLFLGLIHGAHPVELSAGAGVAAIELRLDDRRVDKIEHPPWRSAIDLGPALLPHHLVARGLAADGSEVGRAEQWINLPQPLAAVQILLEGSGGARRAHVVWSSMADERPTEIHLSLDGDPLQLDAGDRAPIQMPAAGSAHVLAARLRFPGNVEARTELALTSDDASGVESELTAVPVRSARPEPMPIESLRGRLVAAGQPLAVTAVDREPPQVFIVRAPGFTSELQKHLPTTTIRSLKRVNVGSSKVLFHYVAATASLIRSSSGAAEIFEMSRAFGFNLPALDLLMLPEVKPTGKVEPPRLADAVAEAGVHALGYSAPRAVLLLLAGDDADSSAFDPATVRGYLKSIGVPLFVWAPANAQRFRAWGEVDEIGGYTGGLSGAAERLTRELASQQIAWVRGRYLPQSITLAPPPAGGHDDLTLLFAAAPATP